MTNLWAEASRDHDAEHDAMQRSAAKIATARFWPFLAEASTERAFGHRLATVKDEVIEALASSGITSARFQEEALAGLAEDFRLLASTRKTAASKCPDCNGTGAVPALGSEDEDEVDNGQVQCKTCGGSGEVSGKEASRKTAAAPALPLLRGFGADGKHYSRHGYLEAGSAEEYWVHDDDGYHQIDQAEYEAALAKAQADPKNDPYGNPWRHGSRRQAAVDVGVGDGVIWTEFGVPDFSSPEFLTGGATNGRPWTITKIETFGDYVLTEFPNGGASLEPNLYDFADEWIRKHPYTGISDEPDALEVAHIERGSEKRVVPLGALVRSSVEVGQGQGLLPGLASKGWPEMPKVAADSGWTGMDAIDEAGLHAGKEHCSQGNPACNWGWRDSGNGTKEYACSVHGTVQTKSHSRESARKQAAADAMIIWAAENGIDIKDPSLPQRFAARGEVRQAGVMDDFMDGIRAQFQGDDEHQPDLYRGQEIAGGAPGYGNFWYARCICGWEQPEGTAGGPRGFPSEEQALRRWNNHFRSTR